MAGSYEQAFADHKFLWSIAPASDMTGGYVDSEDLEKLLEKPTKATARACLERQCAYWFHVGTEDYGTYEQTLAAHPHYAKKLRALKERYDP